MKVISHVFRHGATFWEDDFVQHKVKGTYYLYCWDDNLKEGEWCYGANYTYQTLLAYKVTLLMQAFMNGVMWQ